MSQRTSCRSNSCWRSAAGRARCSSRWWSCAAAISAPARSAGRPWALAEVPVGTPPPLRPSCRRKTHGDCNEVISPEFTPLERRRGSRVAEQHPLRDCEMCGVCMRLISAPKLGLLLLNGLCRFDLDLLGVRLWRTADLLPDPLSVLIFDDSPLQQTQTIRSQHENRSEKPRNVARGTKHATGSSAPRRPFVDITSRQRDILVIPCRGARHHARSRLGARLGAVTLLLGALLLRHLQGPGGLQAHPLHRRRCRPRTFRLCLPPGVRGTNVRALFLTYPETVPETAISSGCVHPHLAHAPRSAGTEKKSARWP